ncbi:MAG: class I SAM-dependent methyltransferase [Candidatus Promineifilaceae bacterium]
MLFNSPLSSEKANQIIQLLDISQNGRILDIGCGTGEFLIRAVEATGANGLGIDMDGDAVSAAQENAAGRLPDGSYEFQTADIQAASLSAESFDVVICLGSTHAFGSGEAAYPNALQGMTALARPGGLLLIGEGYWKRPPAQPYLALIGDPVGIYRTHAENISFAEAQGLIPLYAVVSNDDEWDHFEWSHRMRIEREGVRNPDDPAVAEKVKRSRVWRDGYLRWGRSTMGFGFYLFMK